MFVGHYAAALAADAVEPRAPLWSYVLGCQLLDVAWGVLTLGGVEHFSIDPTLPGNALFLYDTPLSHGLPGALALSILAALAMRGLLKTPWRAAVLVGAVVFSHWLLDFLVHRPDLELWPRGPMVGLSGWNAPVPEATLEIGLLAIAGGAWMAARNARGLSLWPGLLFLAGLIGAQLGQQFMPLVDGEPRDFAVSALAVYVSLTAWAAFLGRRGLGLMARPIPAQ
jgi:hypothetical protein